MKFIKPGFGFTVGQDFARATNPTPIELAPSEYAQPGNVIGYIEADPKSSLGFLRNGASCGSHVGKVRVHVLASALADTVTHAESLSETSARQQEATRTQTAL